MSQRVLNALGTMSGTSMDGIDLAILHTDGIEVADLGPALTVPYGSALRSRLGDAVGQPDALSAGQRDALERDLTEAHAAAITRFLADWSRPLQTIDVIGFHGHTLVHRPEQRVTVQLGDGERLARLTGTSVVSDFRSADVRAGGQGAPFAPLYHAALARGLEHPVAVLNLGGVGNVTFIDGDTIFAFDTGPGNALLDDWVHQHTGLLFDQDGRLAAAGRVDLDVVQRLLADSFFARPGPKSLDRNAFSLEPVRGLAVEDGAATLAAFTAASVAAGLPHLPGPPKRWLVTGGGRHNPSIMAGLRRELRVPVAGVETVGWSGDALEAQAFGFLAVRSLHGLPLSLPTTTGVHEPVSGGIIHRARAG